MTSFASNGDLKASRSEIGLSIESDYVSKNGQIDGTLFFFLFVVNKKIQRYFLMPKLRFHLTTGPLEDNPGLILALASQPNSIKPLIK